MFHEFAFLRFARHDGAPLDRYLPHVEPELGLTAVLVVAVADKSKFSERMGRMSRLNSMVLRGALSPKPAQPCQEGKSQRRAVRMSD